MKKLILIIIISFSNTVSANLLENTFDKFSYFIFKAGWPTATYVDYEFFEVNHSEKYVIVQMNGTSFWSDGKLNMRIKVAFNSNFGIDNVKVIKHNALIMEPFKTLELLNEVIKNSNSFSNSSSANPAYNSGNSIRVMNECHKSIRIAIRYKKITDDWVSSGWWEISQSKGIILYSNDKPLQTKNSVLYYFAESYDKEIVWKGSGNSKYLDGKKLEMRRVHDNRGDIDITLAC